MMFHVGRLSVTTRSWCGLPRRRWAADRLLTRKGSGDLERYNENHYPVPQEKNAITPLLILLYLKYLSQVVVCNYGPGGNILGWELYGTEGDTGSKCPNGVENGLCL